VIELGYSREHNFLMSRATGKIVLADLLAFHDRMDKLNVAADYRSLADFRSADLSSLSSSDIRRNKQGGNEVAIRLGGNDRFALVVDKPFEFGMGRMYEMIDECDELTMRVFRSFDDAIVWLDVSKKTVGEVLRLLKAPSSKSVPDQERLISLTK